MLIQLLGFSLTLIKFVRAYNNGLARTPQMGWNTWNKFGCNISEDLILSSAKTLISTGLNKLGYEYVLIDDCWHAPTRDPKTSAPVEDPERFPHGIKWLSNQVHELGLKIGIYSSAGTLTCAQRYGSLGFEEIDAQTYASWDIDYLKYDNCFNEGEYGLPQVSYKRYAKMSAALNATGRPILYAICNWGEDQPWNWAPTISNSWRMSGDIIDQFDRFDERCPCETMFDCKFPGYHCSMARIMEWASSLVQKSHAGAWNDLDMLEVGNGGMTRDEYITHFSMWSLLKSPLLLGNDITNMTDETLEIISNDAIIAINQDPKGSPVIRAVKHAVEGGTMSVWVGRLIDDAWVVAITNLSPSEHTATVSFRTIFLDEPHLAAHSYELFDLWKQTSTSNRQFTQSDIWGKSLGVVKDAIYSIRVATHATRVFKLVPSNSTIAGGEEMLADPFRDQVSFEAK